MLFEPLGALIRRQRPTMAAVDGARLKLVGRNAWTADRELVYRPQVRLPLRMVVLRDSNGSLSLYSPVGLDEGTIEALAGLGEVRRIIVPNRFHTLFVGRAMDVYPAARLLLPLADAQLLSRFPERASPVTAPFRIDALTEIVPVALRPGFDELVIYHDDAELLVLGDLFNNQHAHDIAGWSHRLNRWWQQAPDSGLQRLLLHLLLQKDRASLARFYRWAMSKPFSQISMAHGQLVSSQARETFYQAFHHYHDSHSHPQERESAD